ncbi:MAG: NTP transferase domain-containing protein [Planctomycetes bacterium]|nr:NTP transferase domain-containing protein [Planctomycetota bacterium]
MRPALVILAAGASERLGEPKALCELGGVTALERLLAAGADACDGAPLVVVGAHAEQIAARAPLGVEIARHAAWSRGRTSSLKLARRLRPGRDLLVAPVDVPLVERAVFQALVGAWLAARAPALGFLAPCVSVATRPPNGTVRRHGHPVLVGRELALELETLSDDAPLSKLRERARPRFDVDVSSASILDDLDTPADLARMRAELDKSAQV